MVARSPAPIRSKPSAVPANDRLRPDNRNRVKDGGEPVIKPNKQKTIGIVEVRSIRCPPAKHIDLLPQDQDFCFQLCSRPEERSQDAENQLEKILHQAVSLSRLFSASMPNRIFGTHSLGAWELKFEDGIDRLKYLFGRAANFTVRPSLKNACIGTLVCVRVLSRTDLVIVPIVNDGFHFDSNRLDRHNAIFVLLQFALCPPHGGHSGEYLVSMIYMT